MTHTGLPADEKTHTGRCRDLSRERRNAERKRAAWRMLRERRRLAAALGGDMTAGTGPRNTPT